MPGKISRELALLLTGKDVSWSKTTKGAEKSLKRLHDAGAKAGTNMARNLERGVVVASAAAVGAGAFAVDQAMQFESSSASVRKTIEGNVDAILAANRALATTTGLEVNTLNEISATAGALGIAKDDVDDFTKTVSMLGQTTDDVSTDLGATSLGHLKTTLNLAGTDFEHVGNTLVALGNDGASTEGQILSMTESIAGAAGIMDASTPQVLGWAAALANTGEEAEAGGSSIQRFWLESFKSVEKGGAELKLMAEISGQTVDAFRKDFGQDATGTLAKFIARLGELGKAEQLTTLEALGFTDIRITRALLKLTANTDNLTDSLALSQRGWLENNAGTEEWGKRLDTTASKLAILRANVNDAAITIGSELLPVLADLSTDAVKWISEHQGDIRQFSQDLGSGVREAVTWAKSLDWDAIGSGLQIAAGAAGAIVQAFAGAPPWVQALLVGGFAANKFTGGAVTDVVKIAFDQFAGRGASPANPIWVQQVGGFGVGGKGGVPPVAGAPSAAAVAGFLAPGLGTAVIGALTPFLMLNVIPKLVSAPGGDELKPGQALGLTPVANQTMVSVGLGNLLAKEAAKQGLLPRTTGSIGDFGAPHPGSTNAGSRTAPAFDVSSFERRRDLDSQAILERALRKGFNPTEAAVQATLQRNIARDQAAARAAIERTNAKLEASRSADVANSIAEQNASHRDADRLVTAIRSINLAAPAVNVNVTATDIQRAETRRRRIVKPNGSRGAWFEQYG